MFPLTVKSKEATFAVISMTADAQLKGRDMEGFRDNHYLPPTHPKRQQPRQETTQGNS